MGTFCAVVLVFLQIFEFSGYVENWGLQWLIGSGLSQLLFFFITVAMMCIWGPQDGKQRFAYSEQRGVVEAEETTIDVAEAADDPEDVDVNSEYSGLKANTIGNPVE